VNGVVLAAMAGVGFGLFQALNRRVNAAIDVYRGTFAVLAVSTSLLVLISLITDDLGSLTGAPPVALGAFAAAGLVHFFLGWTFLGLAQQRLGAARTGALLGSVPLVGALLAAVVLGEALTLRTLGALLVVVCGVVAISLRPRARGVDQQRSSTVSLPGLGFALATATCWSVSPLLIRGGLDLFPAPLLGVTVGIATTTVAYGIAVASSRRATDGPLGRPLLGLIALAGTLVGLAIWWQWTAFELAPIAVALAVMQLSAPVVALVSPLLSSDPLERGGVLLWVGLALVLTGALTFLLGGA
jgi:drug/metabolite transporter (DMT)-like permease